jgi:hypothetical protein
MPENIEDDKVLALELERKVQNFILDLRQAGFTVTFDIVEVEGRVILTLMGQMGTAAKPSTGGQ